MDINENTISFNENENKNKEVKNAASNDKLWKKVTFGTASGILLGAGAIFAVNRISQDDAPEAVEKLAAAPQNAQEEVVEEAAEEAEAAEATETTAVESDATIYDQAPVAEVSDKLSFDDAFAQARAEVGPGGVFAWHKGIYGTYYTDEWEAMSDDQKAEFVQSVNPQVRANLVDTDNISEENPDIIIADDNNEVAEDNEEVVDDNEEVADDNEEVVDDNEEVAEDNEEVAEDNEEVAEDNEESEEEAAGEEVAEDENSTFEDEVSELEDVHIVGRTELEGHEALSLDMDGDDKSDVVVIDADDSGNVSADDLLAFSDGSIMTVEEYMNSDYEPGANETDESVVVVDEVETEENVVDTPVEGDLTEEALGDDSMDMASMEDPDDPDSELNEFIDAVDDITTV